MANGRYFFERIDIDAELVALWIQEHDASVESISEYLRQELAPYVEAMALMIADHYETNAGPFEKHATLSP